MSDFIGIFTTVNLNLPFVGKKILKKIISSMSSGAVQIPTFLVCAKIIKVAAYA